MPFHMPQDKYQNDLLNDILSSLKNIQSSIDSLNKRLDKLESSQLNSLSSIKTNSNTEFKKLYFNNLIFIIIITILIIFGFHFWDVPAQTNAINQYIYEKIINEQPHP